MVAGGEIERHPLVREEKAINLTPLSFRISIVHALDGVADTQDEGWLFDRDVFPHVLVHAGLGLTGAVA